MRLTVRDVAKLLGVSEKTVHHWVDKDEIPSYRLKEQRRFSKAEIVEWAASRGMSFAEDPGAESPAEEGALPLVGDAVETGGIFYGVEGKDKPSVLRAIVDSLCLPDDVDRDYLHSILLAREAMGSTGVGDGIAIPHVRNPIVLNDARPSISLCFLKHPIDFDAVDGKPVRVLFTIISPTIRLHLHLLSRLGFILHDAGCKAALLATAGPEDILKNIRRVEGAIEAGAGKGTRR
ncbi:MAG TPA: PTS sugar transporter subunit IIA [bacterium]|nr:PTS sugar transporter subunit IIA [bacterium]